jgi:hypothetical protein
MYNQFIPPDGFRPVSPPPGTPPKGRSPLSTLLSSLLGKGGNGGGNAGGKTGLAGLLDRFGLGQLDHGDLLLLFILIYLFRESEDDEWLIILALVLLMGL